VGEFSKAAYLETPKGLSLATSYTWSELPPRAIAGFEAHALYFFARPNLRLDVRCRVFPLCDGSTGFYLLSISLNEDGARAAESWLDGLATTRTDPPFCSARP
jgi:hypothetical protein